MAYEDDDDSPEVDVFDVDEHLEKQGKAEKEAKPQPLYQIYEGSKIPVSKALGGLCQTKWEAACKAHEMVWASWDEAFTGWSAQKQSGRLDGEIEIGYWGMGTNYYNEARTALPFVVDQPNGENAWTRCEETIAAKTLESGTAIDWVSDPTWAIVPRHAT